MNSKSVTLRSDLFLEALAELEKQGMKTIRNRLLLAVPEKFFKEGTDLWWERSHLDAFEDIKHGRVSPPFDNAKDLIAALEHKPMKYDRSFRSKISKSF